MTRKNCPDQGNLFGGSGAVTEEQIAVATGVELVMHYLKCRICGTCSPPIMIPRPLLGDPARAQAFAMRAAGWVHECPDCEKAGNCRPCAQELR